MTIQKIKTREEAYFKITGALQENPDLTLRELAQKLGISVGGVNYCLKTLIDKGFVKIGNFQKSKNKFKYVYLLTRKGMSEKMAIASRFLMRKIEEYDALKQEIEALKFEAEMANKSPSLNN